MVQQIRIFFSLKPSASPEGNHPSKFLLIRINRFGGVREQTNTQTHSHPIALEEGLSIDWTYLMYAILQCMEYLKEKDGKYFSSFSPSPLSFIALQDGIGFLTKDDQFLCNLLT